MPGSTRHGKAEIKKWIESQPDIKVIVDVGAGSATYPKLLGDKYLYKGIEIWAPYISQWNLRNYYAEIRIGDVRYIEFPRGDCIIFGDILEHLGKGDALVVLERAERKYPHVVVSIPLGKYPSEEHYGNEFEKHLSTWEFDELCKDYPFRRKCEDIGVFAR